MALKPCPNCGWMCNDADAACNMCGKSTGFAGARPAAAPAPPPPVPGAGGAYAPPGPPGAGYPAPTPPPAISPMYGGAAPPPQVSPGGMGGGYGGGYGQPPPVPQGGGYGGPPGPQGGGYGGPPAPQAAYSPGGFSSAPIVNEAVSPWAAAPAAPAAPVAPPPPPPPPSPQTQNPQFGAPPPQNQQYGVPAQSPYGAQPAYGQPAPAPAPSNFSGALAPPPVVGPGGVIAPPPAPPAPLGGGNFAPPPIIRPGVAPPPPGAVAPPPILQPGGMPAMVGVPQMGVPQAMPAGASGTRVLVGFLVTFQNDPNGAFWAIHSGRLQLGRSAAGPTDGIDVGLPDPSASSRHASIYADPSTGQAYVEDDGSRNGTFLNEQRLSPGERRQLRDSDRLRIGSTTFVVKLLVS